MINQSQLISRTRPTSATLSAQRIAGRTPGESLPCDSGIGFACHCLASLFRWECFPLILMLGVLGEKFLASAQSSVLGTTLTIEAAESNLNVVLFAFLAAVVTYNWKRISLVQWRYLVVLGAFMAINACRSFEPRAAFEDGARYLLPVIVFLYGFVFRHRLLTLVAGFLGVVIINDLCQVWLYVSELAFGIRYFPASYSLGPLPRATGLSGLTFALMNLSAAVLVTRFSGNNRGRIVASIFLGFSLLTLSFKSFPAVILFLIWRTWRNTTATILLGSIGLLLSLALVGSSLQTLIGIVSDGAGLRVQTYIHSAESARRESYRVMWESLSSGNLIGEGLGAFGGPASIKYRSPTYEKYAFNWYYCGNLHTTDTFYPHVFVELGLLGGAWYLLLFFLPLYSPGVSRDNRMTYALLAVPVLLEGLAAFTPQSLEGAFSSFLFLPGLAVASLPYRQLVRGSKPRWTPARTGLFEPS